MILPQQMTQKVLAEQWKQGVQIMYRNQTKEVRIGDVVIGGDHPIAIQSMTNTKTEDVAATVAQIKQLTKAGCEIIRCAVPTQEAAAALTEIGCRGGGHATKPCENEGGEPDEKNRRRAAAGAAGNLLRASCDHAGRYRQA